MLEDRTVGDLPVDEKIVLVTGGGSGINLEYAKLVHEAGASTIIADRALTDDAKALIASSNGRVVFQETDVSDWVGLKAAFERSKAEFKDVPDVVVNGAGLFEPPWSSFWDDTEDSRYVNIDVNLSGLVKLTRLAMKALASHGKKGVVVNVASSGGLTGSYIAPMYCATKSAVIGFTRSLALADRLEGIKVVAVCPAAVGTPLWTGDKAKIMKALSSKPVLPAVDVARTMFDMTTQAAYGGGSIVEVYLDPATHQPTTNRPQTDLSMAAGNSLLIKDLLNRGELPPPLEHAKSVMDSERSSGNWPS